MPADTYEERKKYVLKQTFQILGIGFAYFCFSGVTGIYIPCPIRLITGYKCPGCGITHYVLAMIHGNLSEAYASNQLLFFLIPALLLYGGFKIRRYIKDGRTGFNIFESILLSLVFMITIAFGIYRNIK